MRLGINFGYQDWGDGLGGAVAHAQEAERLGFHSVWTAEAYGTDAVTPLTWMLAHTEKISSARAIMQMPARTPAMTAMTAATLDQMSGGRFLLGLGAVGPAGRRGLARRSRTASRSASTREYVEIVRDDPAAREAARAPRRALRHPVHGPGRDRPRQAAQDHRAPAARRHPDLPRGDRAEERRARGRDRRRLAADLLLAVSRSREAYGAALDAGFAKAGGGKSLAGFDIAPTRHRDRRRRRRRAAAASIKPMLALYVGGMGARGKNFYNDLACRYGYEAAAKEIQDLYLDGKKAGGDRGRARRAGRRGRARRTEGAHPRSPRARGGKRGVTTMIVARTQPEALRAHGRARALNQEGNECPNATRPHVGKAA